MDLLTIIVILIVVIGAIALLKGKQKASPDKVLPYVKKDAFFTEGERVFYRALKSAVGHQYKIFGQVRIADLIDVKKGLTSKERQGWFNKIKSKHADFVLCDPSDLKVICAIELDDKSHNQPKRVERDAFLNSAFESAGLPLIRFKAKHAYDEIEIVTQLQQFIEVTEKSPVVEKEPVVKKEAKAASYKKVCPKCNSNMLRKKVTKGDHIGELFWCCSNFPSCKTIMPLAE